MLFSSIPFIICFLPLTLLIYYYCPQLKARNYFLLAAGLIFYAWGEPKQVLVMLCSILVNYRIGVFLGEAALSSMNRRCILALGVLSNTLLLFYFKYAVFTELVINKIMRMLNYPQFQLPLLSVALPLGISFYTFQSISYLVDVYKKPESAEKNLLHLGLYISFFPQLIAGPIVRYHDISEQITRRKQSIGLFASGIERFIIGLSKKTLIANSMAGFADSIFAFPPDSVPYYYLVLGVICYTFQIYYDFSGYSDMAIGLGKMFGFTILENFNYPYISKTITEFWRRWHISLSSWFKDYLYIPLGGNRKGRLSTTINLFIVFVTTGLWHGAGVNFVFWGFAHGLLLFGEKTFGGKIASVIPNRRLRNFLGHLYTPVCVGLLWVFFRCGMRHSLRFLKALFTLNPGKETVMLFIKTMIHPPFLVSCIGAVIFSIPWWRRATPYRFNSMPLRYCTLILLLALSICSLASRSYNPFIYFRF